MLPRAETASVASTLVVLCGDLQRGASGLDPAALAQELTASVHGLRVLVQDRLCNDPGAIRHALRGDTKRLVLGVCSGDYPELEIQAAARKAGLDPLGIQAVDLGRTCAASTAPMATASRLLRAAVARAAAFAGSRPDNLKSVFLPGQQKVSRRALFTLPPVSYLPVPTINHAGCTAAAGCNQCVMACPHEALFRGGSTIRVDRDRCQSCGACVAACPERAVELPGWSAPEIEAEVGSLLAGDARTTPPALAFVCGRAASPVPAGWLAVRVPCLTLVSTAMVLQALARGASAVALAGCEEICVSGAENAASGRVDYCRRLLILLGHSADRVQRAVRPDMIAQPPAALTVSPPANGADRGPMRLFGWAATADAIGALAAGRTDAAQLTLEHPWSPLGSVHLDTQACTACGACASACPTKALTFGQDGDTLSIAFDHARCLGCGRCVSLCPERAAGAIRMVRLTDLGLVSGGRRVLLSDRIAACQRCGAPVASQRALRRIAGLLGPAADKRLGTLCTGCRTLPV